MENSRLFRATVYELVIGCVGILATIAAIPFMHVHNWLLAALLVFYATIIEAIPVPVGKAVGSLMIALPIGAMVIYGPAEAVGLSVAATFLASFLTPRKEKLSTSIFNTGQNGLSMLAMVLVYRMTYSAATYSLFDWRVVVGVLLGLLAYVLVNHSFVHSLLALRGLLVKGDILQILLADGLNLLMALPLAFLMIGVGNDHQFLGPIVMLPIALIGQVIRLYRETKIMHEVHTVTGQLTSEFDVAKLCEVAATTATRLAYADAVVVFVYDEDADLLVPKVVHPESGVPNFNMTGHPEADGGVIWSVIRENRWTYVPDTTKDSRVIYDGHGILFRSLAIFPMVTRGMVQGAIVCYAERPYAFPQYVQHLQTLASQLAVLLENAKLYRKLHEQSARDGATGLYNYRYFYEELDRRVRRARESAQPVSAAVVDVDYFKKFNDTYGHLAGDVVLRSVGQLLASLAGPDACVARYGGEEFGIILPCGMGEAYEKLEEIRVEVSKHVVEHDGYRLQGITVSSGLATFPEDAATDRDLLLKADSAMYWGAKQRGRNRTAVYSPEFDAQLFIDELTGLYTYHFLNIKIREELAAGVRAWGVICLDLENFNYVNSAFGFDVGDKVLKETSMLIKESLRQNELACRFGGDEFLVLLPNITDGELTNIAERVVNTVSSHRFRGGPSVILSLRTNVVVECFEDVGDATSLLDQVSTVMNRMQTSFKGESLA